jgi:hypothetical protein
VCVWARARAYVEEGEIERNECRRAGGLAIERKEKKKKTREKIRTQQKKHTDLILFFFLSLVRAHLIAFSVE